MRSWKCGRHTLPLGTKTYVMGIVNVTPDSFSGDGRIDFANAIAHAEQLAAEGADILDVGGESTRPGAAIVSEEEELRRVIPLILHLAAVVDIPISVDTTKAVVAREAIAAGASIINDVSACMHDSAMLATLAASDCGYVLMHRRGTPQTMGWSSKPVGDQDQESGDLIAEITGYFAGHIARLDRAGIALERICLDAGFGFGKSYQENLEIIRRGAEFRTLGCPILSATSRKSTIGKALGDIPAEERIWGTAATVALAIANGCDIVRVHDVCEMRELARMTDAVVR